jgi:hypothetical protein
MHTLATEHVQIIRIMHHVYMHTLLVINDTFMHILNNSMARTAWEGWAAKRSMAANHRCTRTAAVIPICAQSLAQEATADAAEH